MRPWWKIADVYKKVCKSKNKAGDKRDQNSTEDKNKEDAAAILGEGLFSMREADALSAISSGDLVYDKFRKRWVQRHTKDVGVDRLGVRVQVCTDSYKQLQRKQAVRPLRSTSPINISGIADTGCSTLCAGPDVCRKLGVPVSSLLESSITLKVADGRKLTILGSCSCSDNR